MKVHLRFLRNSDFGREALENAGWLLERDVDDSVWARHPYVVDEPTARSRLLDVGLLTACSVAIEFIKAKAGATAGADVTRRPGNGYLS